KHLHRIGKASSPLCPTCLQHDETVLHFLLQCPVYAQLRSVLQAKLGPTARDISKLLNTPKALKPLFQYINSTQRFHATPT
ncbi:hypothetical protein BYT27DRAFT_7103927, partial [Phlegmacium glaucopus]